MPKIIGIDPGIAATGIGIVWGTGLTVKGYSFGMVRTPKKSPLSQRLNTIFGKLLSVLKDERPDLMVIEDIFSLDKYPKSGIHLGKACGVILLAGHQADVPTVEVPVREAKQVLTGNGNADKVQMEKTVRNLLAAKAFIKPDHASDALAMALIGLYRSESYLGQLGPTPHRPK